VASLMLWALTLGGCVSGVIKPDKSEGQATVPTVDRDTSMAVMLASTIQTLQRLAQSGAAEQAEIMSTLRLAFERAPLGSAQLRYALALTIPGPVTRDPQRARILLRELSAQPESLAPAERALLLVQLAQLDRELGLSSENQRLQAEAQRSDRERTAVANRRLQAELDENAKLRKQLEEAQAKLDAIALIERNLTDRPATEGRKP
jgi:type IV secretory pathway VirJ component